MELNFLKFVIWNLEGMQCHAGGQLANTFFDIDITTVPSWLILYPLVWGLASPL